jgi:hypothetical protein
MPSKEQMRRYVRELFVFWILAFATFSAITLSHQRPKKQEFDPDIFMAERYPDRFPDKYQELHQNPALVGAVYATILFLPAWGFFRVARFAIGH